MDWITMIIETLYNEFFYSFVGGIVLGALVAIFSSNSRFR